MWIREKGREMKRTGFLLATAMAFVICLAVPALAADGSSLPNSPGGPGVSGSGGTAFTGANVQTTFLYLVAFLVVGAVAVYFGRRRSIAAR
jgi:hypothetical protein